MWTVESSASVLLALNRCVKMASRKWSRVLYSGHLTWLWCMLPVVYGVLNYWFWYKPAFFSGIYAAWFFNPHVGYYDDVDGIVRPPHTYFHPNRLILVPQHGAHSAQLPHNPLPAWPLPHFRSTDAAQTLALLW